eukprot:12710-Heterococcus_DN1.PRE.2
MLLLTVEHTCTNGTHLITALRLTVAVSEQGDVDDAELAFGNLGVSSDDSSNHGVLHIDNHRQIPHGPAGTYQFYNVTIKRACSMINNLRLCARPDAIIVQPKHFVEGKQRVLNVVFDYMPGSDQYVVKELHEAAPKPAIGHNTLTYRQMVGNALTVHAFTALVDFVPYVRSIQHRARALRELPQYCDNFSQVTAELDRQAANSNVMPIAVYWKKNTFSMLYSADARFSLAVRVSKKRDVQKPVTVHHNGYEVANRLYATIEEIRLQVLLAGVV